MCGFLPQPGIDKCRVTGTEQVPRYRSHTHHYQRLGMSIVCCGITKERSGGGSRELLCMLEVLEGF